MMKKYISAVAMVVLITPMTVGAASIQTTSERVSRADRLINAPCERVSQEQKARCLARQKQRTSIRRISSEATISSYDKINKLRIRQQQRLEQLRNANRTTSQDRQFRRSRGQIRNIARETTKSTRLVNSIRSTRNTCMKISSHRERSACLEIAASSVRSKHRTIYRRQATTNSFSRN